MNFIIAPDKFKGCLTTFEICRIIAEAIKTVEPAAKVGHYPLSDGGDGFASVLQYYWHTEAVPCATVDPLGRSITAHFQWSEQNKTAVIESAAASGLALLKEEERNPMQTSTYGTGLLMKAAMEKGAVKIILGIGGSATNDAGTGILAALGFLLLDAAGAEVTPCGKNLSSIVNIIPPPGLPAVDLEIACDVDNPLAGPDGAAYVYAPQKGASPEAVKDLDDGLRHFASVLRRQTGTDVQDIPGAGAAGGIAAGLLPYFPVTLTKGVDLVLAAGGVPDTLQGADYIITGEGCIDGQSLQGKVVGRMAELGRQRGIPVIAFCGTNKLGLEVAKAAGIGFVFPPVNEFITPAESLQNAGMLLRSAMVSSMLFIKWSNSK